MVERKKTGLAKSHKAVRINTHVTIASSYVCAVVWLGQALIFACSWATPSPPVVSVLYAITPIFVKNPLRVIGLIVSQTPCTCMIDACLCIVARDKRSLKSRLEVSCASLEKLKIPRTLVRLLDPTKPASLYRRDPSHSIDLRRFLLSQPYIRESCRHM